MQDNNEEAEGSQGQVPDPVENRYFCLSFVKLVRDLSLMASLASLNIYSNSSG